MRIRSPVISELGRIAQHIIECGECLLLLHCIPLQPATHFNSQDLLVFRDRSDVKIYSPGSAGAKIR